PDSESCACMRPVGERATVRLSTNRYGKPRSKSCSTAASGCMPQSSVMLTLTRRNGSLPLSCSIGILEGMLQPAPSCSCAATTSVARWIRSAEAVLGSLAERKALTVAPPRSRSATRFCSSGCSAMAAAYFAWIDCRSCIWPSTLSSGATNHQCSSTKYAIASATSASTIAATRDCIGVMRRPSMRIGGGLLFDARGQLEALLACGGVGLDHTLQLGFPEYLRAPQLVDQCRGLVGFALDVETAGIVQRHRVQPCRRRHAPGQFVEHRQRRRVLGLALHQELRSRHRRGQLRAQLFGLGRLRTHRVH